jgi:hypothetical protein
MLKKNNIEHVFVGALAAMAYGRPRATLDADIVLLVDFDKAEQVLAAIEEAGRDISRREYVLKKLQEGRPAKIIWDDIFSFDLRLASYGIDVEAIRRARTISLGDEVVRIAPPEEIIVYKLARFQGHDREDIRGILRTQKALDWERMEDLAEDLADQAEIPEIQDRLEQIKTWRRL